MNSASLCGVHIEAVDGGANDSRTVVLISGFNFYISAGISNASTILVLTLYTNSLRPRRIEYILTIQNKYVTI